MYPDRPKTAADLVPLPAVEGPKLQPFDFNGPQKIKFLERLGEGSHSEVYKVEILGTIYALKIFKFTHCSEWSHWIRNVDYVGFFPPSPPAEELQALYPYLDHFSNECRAFGRLRDAGCEDLAVKCFGYILLDEDSERQWAEFTNSEYGERDIEPDMQNALMTDPAGPPPPFRCIVKEFGQGLTNNDFYALPARDLRNLFKTICRFHNLGIIFVDAKSDQIIDGKHGDFSTAVTTPHIITTPEMNPQLSELQKSCLELEAFWLCVHDFTRFDEWVSDWVNGINFKHHNRTTRGYVAGPPLRKDYEGPFAYPRRNQEHGPENRYKLRPSTLDQRTYYTFADPRRYDWTASSSPSSSSLTSSSPRLQESDAHAKKRGFIRRPRNSRHWRGASRSMWCYHPDPAMLPYAKLRLRNPAEPVCAVHWEVQDGYISPKNYIPDRRSRKYVSLDTGLLEDRVERYLKPHTPAEATGWIAGLLSLFKST